MMAFDVETGATMFRRSALLKAFMVLTLVAFGVPRGFAADLSPNTQRFDPYKNFKFRLIWDGREVAAANKASVVKSDRGIVEFRAGADPSTARKSPGRNEFDAITLERGITYDAAFSQWANQVSQFGSDSGSEVSRANYRKELILEVYDEAGQLAASYRIHRAWVSEYNAMPDLDANANAIAIEHIKIENEGWERDPSVTGPIEPKLKGK